MPISSRTAADMLAACLCANSPRIFEERSATSWQTLARSLTSGVCVLASMGSGVGVAHDAVGSETAACAPRIVQVVQVGYGLAHGKKSLVRVELAPEEHPEQLARALAFAPQRLPELLQPRLVVLLELRDPLVRAAE